MYKARRILLRNAFGVAGGRDLPLQSQREARRSSRALEVSKAVVLCELIISVATCGLWGLRRAARKCSHFRPFFRPISAKLLSVAHLPGQDPSTRSPAMFKLVLFACFFVAVSSIASEARPYRIDHAPECNVIMPCDFSHSQTRRERVSRYSSQAPNSRQLTMSVAGSAVAAVNVTGDRIVGGRPAGCPSSFCGCGAALRVFGRLVPELNLAANWLRFPRTSPAPGMVAARRGHVFVLEQHLGGDMWMAYDANSGGHATRMHARSLRGYTVVNPRGTTS